MKNLKSVIVLTAISLVVALALSAVNMVTSPIIEKNAAAAADGAYLEVENIYPYAADNEIVMALYDMKGIADPYQFLKEAYTSIELVTRYTMFPVAVFNTKNNQVEVIHR